MYKTALSLLISLMLVTALATAAGSLIQPDANKDNAAITGNVTANQFKMPNPEDFTNDFLGIAVKQSSLNQNQYSLNTTGENGRLQVDTPTRSYRSYKDVRDQINNANKTILDKS